MTHTYTHNTAQMAIPEYRLSIYWQVRQASQRKLSKAVSSIYIPTYCTDSCLWLETRLDSRDKPVSCTLIGALALVCYLLGFFAQTESTSVYKSTKEKNFTNRAFSFFASFCTRHKKETMQVCVFDLCCLTLSSKRKARLAKEREHTIKSNNKRSIHGIKTPGH